MHKNRLHWARAACGVVLVFYGTHHAMFGAADALQEQAVAYFWAGQRKYESRKKASC